MCRSLEARELREVRRTGLKELRRDAGDVYIETSFFQCSLASFYRNNGKNSQPAEKK